MPNNSGWNEDSYTSEEVDELLAQDENQPFVVIIDTQYAMTLELTETRDG